MQTEQPLPTGNLHILKPRKALNKAFLKVKPNRSQIEQFKQHLIQLLDRTNETESEEFHKNLVTDFLKKTYYDPHHFINTKGRTDLVIHNGNKAKSNVGAADTSSLEAEIDRLVYELYGLTEEEIEIVEGSIN